MHWRAISGASLLVLGLAVAPAQAQTSASSHKSLLEQNPSPEVVQAELNRVVHTLQSDLVALRRELDEPSALPPSASQPPSSPSASGTPAQPAAKTPSEIAGLISAMIGVPQSSVPVPQTAQQPGAGAFNARDALTSAAQKIQAAREQQSAGNAAQESVADHPANETAMALRTWQVAFAANNREVLGTMPDWGSMPVDLNASYSGSAIAVMPNGSSLAGSMNMDLQFRVQTHPTPLEYHGFNGNVDFGAAGQVPLSAVFISGVELPTGSAFGGFQAFGGNLVNSQMSGAFHGAQAEVFRGTWSATISDGPNAGVVNGHLGGVVQ